MLKGKSNQYIGTGKYNGYIFTYNENWQSLTVMLPNDKVEDYTAKEIKSSVIKVIIEYFELEQTEINELVTNRIDVHCDYKFRNDEEYAIIKNILKKAPDKFYTYRKRLVLDNEDGYILKYLAVRKNKSVDELISVEDDVLEIEKEGIVDNENDE